MSTGAARYDVTGALAEVHRRIAAAGGDPGQVEVVAVTKGFGPDAVAAALRAGISAVGENYAEELLAKAADPATAGARWHFVGAVQRRKVRRLAPVVRCWQTLSRLVEGEAVSRHAPGAAVLVEVNVTGSVERPGVAPAETASLVRALRALDLDVQGLMAVGPPGDPEQARPGFRLLAGMGADLGLQGLSMGMTDDLEVAVAEGSTMVRIGRGLFGPRPLSRV